MFEEDALIRDCLMSRGMLTERQVSSAIDYSLDRRIRFDEALVSLKLATFEDLGTCLAGITGLPYYPLMRASPTTFCKKMLPRDLVEKWKVFPVEYRAEDDLLTIAISSPDQIKSFVKLEQKQFSHHRLTFSVAPECEIVQAIRIYYQEDERERGAVPAVPDDFNILNVEDLPPHEIILTDSAFQDDRKMVLLEPDIDKGRALQTLLRREGYRNVVWVTSEPEAIRLIQKGSIDHLLLPDSLRVRGGDRLIQGLKGVEPLRIVFYRSVAPLVLGQELPYQSVSAVLVAFVRTMVRQALYEDTDLMRETADRVRYAQLLALRLYYSPLQIDRVVLAALLYDKERFGRWVNALSPAYHLEKVYGEIADPPAGLLPETEVLLAVLFLLEMKRSDPSAMEDIGRIRAFLQGHCTNRIPERTVETLLTLLGDEAFISRIDRPAARILIVDPDETADSAVVLRLVNDGYEVDLAQGAPEALEVLNSRQVDCLIAEMVLGEVDGINLCKTVKNHAVFASLPFVFVSSSSDPRCMAECLRSGADDFLSKPVDLEILSLKIHRLVSRKLGYDSRAGISGSLAQMSVTDLVQMLSSSGKSVKISFSGSGNVCEVYMDQGEIVHAVCGDSVGEPAFFQLMRLSEGDFQVYPAASFSERTIHLPVMGLLLEGARLADESIRDRQSIIENPPRGFDTR